jgi:hypothetical protein
MAYGTASYRRIGRQRLSLPVSAQKACAAAFYLTDCRMASYQTDYAVNFYQRIARQRLSLPVSVQTACAAFCYLRVARQRLSLLVLFQTACAVAFYRTDCVTASQMACAAASHQRIAR